MVFLSLLCWSQLSTAQLDSIEYNMWEQMDDFTIIKNEYFFSKWNGELIEHDSLLFNANRYFTNYSQDYKPDYFDSIQFAIASRTLKTSYGEKVLYDQPIDFIRICWLKETYPVIITFEHIKDEYISLSFKVGNGNYETHGKTIFDTTILLSKRRSEKIRRVMDNENLTDLTNGVTCKDQLHLPNVFFFEFRNAIDENIIVLSECNIGKRDYASVYTLYKIAESSLKRKKGYFTGNGDLTGQ